MSDKNRTNDIEKLKVLNDIDDKYVEEADKFAEETGKVDNIVGIEAGIKRRRFIKGLSAAAACLVLVGGVIAVTRTGMFNNNAGSGKSAKDKKTESVSDTSSEKGKKKNSLEVTNSEDSSKEDVGEAEYYVDGGTMSPDMADDSVAGATDGEWYGGDGDYTDGWDYDYDYDDPDGIPGDFNNAEAGVLTAGRWNDNDNWGFFTNLVNGDRLTFPCFGLNPAGRIAVTLDGVNADGKYTVRLLQDGSAVWTAQSYNGRAFVFVMPDTEPDKIQVVDADGNVVGETAVGKASVDEQSAGGAATGYEDVTITLTEGKAYANNGLQVMFIVDTTGSMMDELTYLQLDFGQIAKDCGTDGITYSVNFYRDEGDAYVTKTGPFTDNLSDIQSALNEETADGGGDYPEAVAQILAETIDKNNEWKDDCNKVVFLVFDAPPHDGVDAQISKSVEIAAAKGIHIVPVIASDSDFTTETFGRALSIMTDGEYVFLTDDSGVGNSHEEPLIGEYDVEPLHDIIVDIINSYK